MEFHDIDNLSAELYNMLRVIRGIPRKAQKGHAMIVSFIGHARITGHNEIKAEIKRQLEIILQKYKDVSCYLGGYGEFDMLAASACRELKKELGGIELVYISPYMTLSEQEKIKEMKKLGLYDASIYPPIENTPPRFAISKRNAWMMENADLIIAYVVFSSGGAYRSLKIAKAKKKPIVMISP